MAQTFSTADPDFEATFSALLGAKREDAPDVDDAVRAIVADVRARGDAALIDLTERFDRLTLQAASLEISQQEIEDEIARVNPADMEALTLAAERIRAYHERQMPEDQSWTDDVGARLGWRWGPVDRAGLYVPGGLASYPSSVLMNAIPAKVAGMAELIVCVPSPDGGLIPLVLAAARIAGVDRVFRIGGAQAIAAMAFGTATIPTFGSIVANG